MPLILRPPTEAYPLPDRLADLGRTRRRVAVAAGLFRVVAVAVGMVLVAAGLDAAVGLPPVVRAGLLAVTLAAAGVAYLRWVRAPAREPVHPLAVAMLLEERFPRLNDSLASAVDFLRADRPPGSGRFRRAAVTRAETLAERYDLNAIVPTGRMWGAFWPAAVALAAAGPLSLIDPPTAAQAVVRLADPFGRHPWPTATSVELIEPRVDPGRRLLHAKGEAFRLRFAVRGMVPDHAVVSVRLAEAGVADDVVPIAHDGEAAGAEVEHAIDGGRVPRDFDFKVVANDYETDWLPVTVAPAPRLVPLDGRPSPQLRLDYPAYTDLPPAALPDGAGVVEAVAGTRVTFRAAADRRISVAAFHHQTDRAGLASAIAVATAASTNPMSALAAQLLADSVTEPIPVRVTGPDGTILEAEFVPPLPGLYALRFADEVGLTGAQLFDFRMFPDPAPVVHLDQPNAARDPLTLLPTASLAVRARAEDRPFAVRALALEYRVGGPDAPARTLTLADAGAAARTLPALTGSVGVAGAFQFDRHLEEQHRPLRGRLKPVGLDGGATIPLRLFTKADGSPPADGDVIAIRAAATDWDDRTLMKDPGRSREVEIRVLGRSSLEAQFQKELADLRPELLRLKDEQRAAREKTDEVAAAGTPPADAPMKLAQAGQAQRTVRNKVSDPAGGLRAKAEQLRRAARANALPRSPTTEKVEAVADELGRIADQHLDAAEPQLDAARLEAERPGPTGAPAPDARKLADAATKAARSQKSVEDGLAALLERLEQWGGAGEVRGEARGLRDQLNRAGEQAEKGAERVAAGAPPDKLTPQEKAALAGPADKLDQIAEQAAALTAKAARLAAEKDAQANALRADAAEKEEQATAAAGPAVGALKAEAEGMRQSADRLAAEAEALRQGVRDAGGQALPDNIREAADALRQNRTAESAAARQSAAERLDRLADPLTERPMESDDQLGKKRDAAKEIGQLARQQDELRKKARAAEQIADPEKRAEELQKLAREQEQLRKKAEQLAQRLTRDRQDLPAEAVRRAADRMAAAGDQFEDGQPAGDQPEQALDKLDEALDKLDAEKQQAEEQLGREKREQIAEHLKAIRARQQAALGEADRIQADLEKAMKWSRGLLASVGDLEDREKQIAAELRAFAEKELTDLPVFNRLGTQSADAMEKAGLYTRERLDDTDVLAPFDPETETVAADRVRRPMQTALRKIDQILDSLKDDPKQARQAPNGGGGGGDEGGGGPQGGGIPPLAQLKALRAMQADVAVRTAAFATEHPDPAKLTDEDRDELEELEQAQRDVAELFEQLADAIRGAAPEVP